MKLKLKIMGVLASVMLMVSAANAVCVQNDIILGDTVYGTWSSDCTSAVQGTDIYAQYYTFTLTESQEVRIDLSSVEDTLILLHDSSENIIAAAPGSPDSQITMTLQAGTYTIEASPDQGSVVGDFSLSLVPATTSTPSTCTVNSIILDSSVLGNWSSGCESVHRTGSYAQYYTFTLTGTEAIQIDLESIEDTYLYLVSDASGTVIAYNDDNGYSFNSRITTELPAGTYTIEATTFSPMVSADFNLSLSRSTLTNYTLNGTINPPPHILALLQNCVYDACPSLEVHVDAQLSNGDYQYIYAPVDYNDTTGQYEYQLDIIADANTSMDLGINVNAWWYDAAYNEYNSLYLQYDFGDDMAVGGVGSAADYPIENYCDPVMPLHVELNTSLPIIEIDLSNYIAPTISQATMVLNNVPSDIEVYLGAYSPAICMYVGGGTSYIGDGPRTLTIDGLRDGVEYGLGLFADNYSKNIYNEYRLNDNDGDFTNGGVFVEDMVYDDITGEPVFDKMLLATPEDINISAPENLNFGNPASALPAVFLLLM